jgi:hypothetical protein
MNEISLEPTVLLQRISNKIWLNLNIVYIIMKMNTIIQ